MCSFIKILALKCSNVIGLLSCGHGPFFMHLEVLLEITPSVSNYNSFDIFHPKVHNLFYLKIYAKYYFFCCSLLYQIFLFLLWFARFFLNKTVIKFRIKNQTNYNLKRREYQIRGSTRHEIWITVVLLAPQMTFSTV